MKSFVLVFGVVASQAALSSAGKLFSGRANFLHTRAARSDFLRAIEACCRITVAQENAVIFLASGEGIFTVEKANGKSLHDLIVTEVGLQQDQAGLVVTADEKGMLIYHKFKIADESLEFVEMRALGNKKIPLSHGKESGLVQRNSFGDRISARRLWLQENHDPELYNVSSMSDVLQVSVGLIYAWENGSVYPALERLGALAEFLHLEEQELINLLEQSKTYIVAKKISVKMKRHAITSRDVLNFVPFANTLNKAVRSEDIDDQSIPQHIQLRPAQFTAYLDGKELPGPKILKRLCDKLAIEHTKAKKDIAVEKIITMLTEQTLQHGRINLRDKQLQDNLEHVAIRYSKDNTRTKLRQIIETDKETERLELSAQIQEAETLVPSIEQNFEPSLHQETPPAEKREKPLPNTSNTSTDIEKELKRRGIVADDLLSFVKPFGVQIKEIADRMGTYAMGLGKIASESHIPLLDLYNYVGGTDFPDTKRLQTICALLPGLDPEEMQHTISMEKIAKSYSKQRAQGRIIEFKDKQMQNALEVMLRVRSDSFANTR